MLANRKRVCLLRLLGLAVLGLGLPATARAGLIWHSAMDGNANALVGTNGVAAGVPTATADKLGRANGAVLFGGNQDYYTIPPQVASLMAGSISVWVRPDVVDGTEDGVIGVGASGGGATEYFSMMNRTDQRWRVDLDDGATRREELSDAVAVAGEWKHLVATFDSNATGSQQLRMYIDGVLQSNPTSIAGDVEPYLDANANNWLIGTERTTERYFNGALDDVRIYDSELSANEVAALFRQGPLLADIPEPATCVLLATGLAGLGVLRRRRLQRRA